MNAAGSAQASAVARLRESEDLDPIDRQEARLAAIETALAAIAAKLGS